MKKGETFILKSAVILLGAVVLALCIFVLPAGLRGVGYYVPVVIGMYIAAIPFYFGLYQAYMLLIQIDKNDAFSEASVRFLKHIKYYSGAISVLYIALMPFIFNAGDKDDAPGVIVIGLVIIFAAAIVAIFAGVLQKLIQSAIDIKSENDLTV